MHKSQTYYPFHFQNFIIKTLFLRFSFENIMLIEDFYFQFGTQCVPNLIAICVSLRHFYLNPHNYRLVPAITFHLIICHSSPISTLLVPSLKTKQQLFSIKVLEAPSDISPFSVVPPRTQHALKRK